MQTTANLPRPRRVCPPPPDLPADHALPYGTASAACGPSPWPTRSTTARAGAARCATGRTTPRRGRMRCGTRSRVAWAAQQQEQKAKGSRKRKAAAAAATQKTAHAGAGREDEGATEASCKTKATGARRVATRSQTRLAAKRRTARVEVSYSIPYLVSWPAFPSPSWASMRPCTVPRIQRRRSSEHVEDAVMVAKNSNFLTPGRRKMWDPPGQLLLVSERQCLKTHIDCGEYLPGMRCPRLSGAVSAHASRYPQCQFRKPPTPTSDITGRRKLRSWAPLQAWFSPARHPTWSCPRFPCKK